MPIKDLFIYPIKSCGGIWLEKFMLTESGPEHDREFTIIDEKTGVIISQRTHPTLALVKPQFDPKSGGLILEAAGMQPLVLPLEEDQSSDLSSIQIHKDTCSARLMRSEYSEWFCDFLHTHCAIVRRDPNSPRIRHADALGRKITVSFADGYPLLVTSVQSLAELNLRIAMNKGLRIPMDRFRPNVVIDRVYGPYGEDEIKPSTKIKAGMALIEAGKLCDRCPITTVNQATGTRSFNEPLATLSKFRKVGSGVVFGRTFGVAEPGMVWVGASFDHEI